MALQGHNVAAECREAATLSLTLEELAALGKDVGSMKLSLNKMAAKSGQWRPHVQIAQEMSTLVGHTPPGACSAQHLCMSRFVAPGVAISRE